MGSRRIAVLSFLALLLTACSAQLGSLPKRGPFSAECREGGADHGNAEKCGLFGGLFSGEGGPAFGAKNIPGLNWPAALAYTSTMRSSSGGMCARGTRLTLGKLFGGQKSWHPGAACQYNLDTFNRNWNSTPTGTRVNWTQTGGSVYEGCVNICKRRGVACGGSKGTAGHAEIYTPNGWSSDFKQRGSVCAGSSYEGTRTYCPRQAGGLAMSPKSIQKLISTFFTLSLLHAGDLPAGHSAEAEETKDSKKIAKQLQLMSKKYKVVVKDGSYELQVEELTNPEVSTLDQFRIFKKGTKDPILEDQSNAFSAINAKTENGKSFYIPKESIRRELALNYVLKLIEVHGLREMETRIKSQTQLTEFQRDAYLDAQKQHPSIKLADKYYILPE